MTLLKKSTLILLLPIFILIDIFLVLHFIKEHDLGLFILDDRAKIESIKLIQNKELIKGKTATGDFVSKYNNLGIIGIRFETFYRDNDSWLEFKIKDSEAGTWYYSAKYKTDQFQQKSIFPIGFPLIQNSANRTYHFEITSIDGKKDNAVAISSEYPNIIGRHVYSKRYFLENPEELPDFLTKKIINLSQYPNFLKNLFIYSLPVIFILLLLSTELSFPLIFAIIFSLIFWDIFFNVEFNDFLFLPIMLAWWYLDHKVRLPNVLSVFVSLGLFLITAILIFFRHYLLIEKITSWAVLFLLYSFIRLPKKNALSTREFLSQLEALLSETVFILGVFVGTLSLDSIKPRRFPRYLFPHITFKRTILYLTRVAWVTLFYFLYLTIKHLISYIKVFYEYFISNQSWLFLSQTGIYLFVLYFSSLGLFLLLVRKFPNLKKIFVAVVFAFIVQWSDSIIFQRTTPFRDAVVLWRVRANDIKEPWLDVFINGRNLRDMPFSGKVYVNGVEQRIMKWSDNEIIFRTDPTTTREGQLYITTYDGKRSNTIRFDYFGYH